VASNDRSFFGHPRGLSTLFFTEMWERFSYYGMRGFLILYMLAPTASGGMGLDTVTAAAIYGVYTSLVYLMSVPGGWLADRVFGSRRAVLYGGILIAAGHFTLAVPAAASFYIGLALIILGTGLLKPNISVIVGALYSKEDLRRDAGFSVFYMGINLGALLGPIVTGYLAQDPSFRTMIVGWGLDPNATWHFAFGAAGVGMTFGLVQFLLGSRHFGTAGIAPGGAPTPELKAKYKKQATLWGGIFAVALLGFAVATLTGALKVDAVTVKAWVGYSLGIITVAFFGTLFADRSWTREERGRLWVIFVLFAASAVFWSVFEQAGSTLNIFADRSTANVLMGFKFPSSWFQSLNSLFLVIFAPIIGWVWLKMGPRQPSGPVKFSFGLIGVGIGFLILVPPARAAAVPGVLVSPMWLTATYFVHTIAELCLSPVGLSSMTKLAPPKIVGAMMGIWFLGTSIGNFLAASMASMYESLPLPTLFGRVGLMPIVVGILLLALARPITRMMHGVR
jgi:POT family proton-dependent oligopeptide transporter